MKLLDYLRKIVIRNVLSPCIGQWSNDAKINNNYHDSYYQYNWGYTEFSFLIRAKFILKDDELHIVNLNENNGYQTNYAENKPTHDKFNEEMVHLFNLLGLSFAPCNFHEEIIFDKKSTDKLVTLGLHINAEYIKELFFLKNNFSMFKRNAPKILPDELFNLIASFTINHIPLNEVKTILKLSERKSLEPTPLIEELTAMNQMR